MALTSIHGKELFNLVSSFKELFRRDEPQMPERVARTRHAAEHNFGIDPQELAKASDEQVLRSFGYANRRREDSRLDAQTGMVLLASAAILGGTGLLGPSVPTLMGIYYLFQARGHERMARAFADNGRDVLQAKATSTAPSDKDSAKVSLTGSSPP